jgi:hypothetical protein
MMLVMIVMLEARPPAGARATKEIPERFTVHGVSPFAER